MNKISHAQVVFINSIAPATSPEYNNEVNVYGNVFKNLTEAESPLGKILPVNLRIGDTEYVLGVVTLNRSGSSSIFLELPGKMNFDHITIVKNLGKGNHHFTRWRENVREKVCPLKAEPLSNGTQYLMTLAIGSARFLKIAPKKVVYPAVPVKQIPRLEDAFITNGNPEAVSVVDTGEHAGVIFIQMFVIPKGVDHKTMEFFEMPLQVTCKDLNLQDEVGSHVNHLIIPHEYQDDYLIGFRTIALKNYHDSELLAFTYGSPKATYSKTNLF